MAISLREMNRLMRRAMPRYGERLCGKPGDGRSTRGYSAREASGLRRRAGYVAISLREMISLTRRAMPRYGERLCGKPGDGRSTRGCSAREASGLLWRATSARYFVARLTA
ncbi:MAG: hypothetical protein U1A77_10035 [Pirellulales bacterium]